MAQDCLWRRRPSSTVPGYPQWGPGGEEVLRARKALCEQATALGRVRIYAANASSDYPSPVEVVLIVPALSLGVGCMMEACHLSRRDSIQPLVILTRRSSMCAPGSGGARPLLGIRLCAGARPAPPGAVHAGDALGARSPPWWGGSMSCAAPWTRSRREPSSRSPTPSPPRRPRPAPAPHRRWISTAHAARSRGLGEAAQKVDGGAQVARRAAHSWPPSAAWSQTCPRCSPRRDRAGHQHHRARGITLRAPVPDAACRRGSSPRPPPARSRRCRLGIWHAASRGDRRRRPLRPGERRHRRAMGAARHRSAAEHGMATIRALFPTAHGFASGSPRGGAPAAAGTVAATRRSRRIRSSTRCSAGKTVDPCTGHRRDDHRAGPDSSRCRRPPRSRGTARHRLACRGAARRSRRGAHR